MLRGKGGLAVAVATTGVALAFPAGATGAVLVVPGEYPTLQAAWESATDGDEIVLAPGSYSRATGEEFPLVIDRSVTLRGAGAPRTFLDGQGEVPLFRIRGAGVVLEGLALVGGSAAGNGGAVRVEAGDIRVARVRFTSNRAVAGGDALAATRGTVHLLNCVVDGNGDSGPALRLDDCTTIVERCTFSTNAGPALDVRGGRIDLLRSVVFEPGAARGLSIGVRLSHGAAFVAEENLFGGCFDGVVSEDRSSGVTHRIGPRGLHQGAVVFADPFAGDFRLTGREAGTEEPGAFGGGAPLAVLPVAGDAGAGEEELLGPSIPNPGRPASTVHFTVPVATVVDLGIYNVLGQRVRSLLSRHLAAGEHTLVWDGRDDAGAELPPGMYFVRVTQGSVTESRRLALVR